MTTFRAGDHLRARRRWGYAHHGIYINASRVIQFGGQGRKRTSNINCVSFDQFANGDPVESVEHGGKGRWFAPQPPHADASERIVERAEWLMANHPTGRYNAVGWNCEHAANFCVNEFGESHQVQTVLDLMLFVALPLAIFLDDRRARSREDVPWVLIGCRLVMIILSSMYRYNKARFWYSVGHDWDTYAGGKCRKYSYLAERPVTELLDEGARWAGSQASSG